MDDMRTEACESPSSAPPTCAATASALSAAVPAFHLGLFVRYYYYITGVDVTVDARGEDGRRQRGLLHAAIDGVVARMAAQLQAAARYCTGPTAGGGGIWSTNGHNVLHLAAGNGRTHVCRYLIQDLGLPVDARTRSASGETPLDLAALYGHTATAAYLLERGANPRLPDSDGNTPLHWAAKNGDRELAMLLLDRDADIDAANPTGTALHLAAVNGRTHVSRYLIQDLSLPVDARGRFSSGDTPLTVAASFGQTATAAYLLDRGADPSARDSDGHTPLHWAAKNGDRELAMLLLDRGADVGTENSGGTALHLAAIKDHPEVVALLLRHGADPNKIMNVVFTPVVSALLAGSLECMKLLIQAGANVNTGGSDGATPLFLACSNRGPVPFVKCLLEAGANPTSLDELGRLPIEVAAVYAQTELVKVLFPVTRRPAAMLDWSVAGIVRHVNSAAYQEQFLSAEVIKASCITKDELIQQGHSAFKRNDYGVALLHYSWAMRFGNRDATLYSDRSICWLRKGNGEQALLDAQACIEMRPTWANGYYCQGMAFHLLEDHASFAEAFLKATKLDREYADIK